MFSIVVILVGSRAYARAFSYTFGGLRDTAFFFLCFSFLLGNLSLWLVSSTGNTKRWPSSLSLFFSLSLLQCCFKVMIIYIYHHTLHYLIR